MKIGVAGSWTYYWYSSNSFRIAKLNCTFTVPIIDIRSVWEWSTVIGMHVCHGDVCACSVYV